MCRYVVLLRSFEADSRLSSLYLLVMGQWNDLRREVIWVISEAMRRNSSDLAGP